MMWIVRSRTFWIATGVFLIASILSIWLLAPSLSASISKSRSTIATLNTQINDKNKLVSAAKTLKENSNELDTLYSKATEALPMTQGTDYLMLQLDALTKSLGLDSSITVPFKSSSAATSSSAASATTTDTVKPGGSATNIAPVVQPSEGAKTTFTLSGKYGYSATLSLLDALQTFGRWNKISSIDITQTGDSATSTITVEVFYSAAKPADFTGEAKVLLSKAQELLGALVSYTTIPSSTTEGSYGRENPFAAIR